jgi:hypothetical protein
LRRAHRADIAARTSADDNEIVSSHEVSPVSELCDSY